jgi:hypothetical protein
MLAKQGLYCLSHISVHFVLIILEMGSHPNRPWTLNFPISASQVAGIIVWATRAVPYS